MGAKALLRVCLLGIWRLTGTLSTLMWTFQPVFSSGTRAELLFALKRESSEPIVYFDVVDGKVEEKKAASLYEFLLHELENRGGVESYLDAACPELGIASPIERAGQLRSANGLTEDAVLMILGLTRLLNIKDGRRVTVPTPRFEIMRRVVHKKLRSKEKKSLKVGKSEFSAEAEKFLAEALEVEAGETLEGRCIVFEEEDLLSFGSRKSDFPLYQLLKRRRSDSKEELARDAARSFFATPGTAGIFLSLPKKLVPVFLAMQFGRDVEIASEEHFSPTVTGWIEQLYEYFREVERKGIHSRPKKLPWSSQNFATAHQKAQLPEIESESKFKVLPEASSQRFFYVVLIAVAIVAAEQLWERKVRKKREKKPTAG